MNVKRSGIYLFIMEQKYGTYTPLETDGEIALYHDKGVEVGLQEQPSTRLFSYATLIVQDSRCSPSK